MDRIKTLETSLVLTTGFLLIYLLTKNDLFLYMAFAFGITGIFIKPLAKYIAIAWFKLADILNFVVSKIILGTLFFVVLFPISVLYKISNKDKLRLKRSKSSTWVERNHTYTSTDLENIW
jgi:polyferredoxin